MSGVRAELVFERPSDCPVAAESVDTEGSLREISWTGDNDGTVTEQFTAPDEADPETGEAVFDYGSQQVYEFEREAGEPCICEYIERSLGPVTETYAMDGDLHVTLHAGDVARLREMLRDLSDQFGDVRIEYLVRGRASTDESELVPVDLRQLTDRQREVVQTAHEMGYFEYPRDANASEVAAALDIEPSTFTEHLNAAQTKLLDELLVRE